jgi:hypothetical protein
LVSGVTKSVHHFQTGIYDVPTKAIIEQRDGTIQALHQGDHIVGGWRHAIIMHVAGTAFDNNVVLSFEEGRIAVPKNWFMV